MNSFMYLSMIRAEPSIFRMWVGNHYHYSESLAMTQIRDFLIVMQQCLTRATMPPSADTVHLICLPTAVVLNPGPGA